MNLEHGFVGLLTRLELDENELTVLTTEMFNHLSSLESPDLDRNKISTIEPDTWFGLDQLTSLKLDRNNLTVLPAGIFNHLSSLRTLNLRHGNVFRTNGTLFSIDSIDRNIDPASVRYRIFPGDPVYHLVKKRIHWIEDGAFNGLYSLKTLGLEDNQLNTSLFTSNALIDVAGNLTSLNLRENPITIIPNDTFNSFIVLETLDIEINDIVEPNGFTGLDSLHEFTLSYTKLMK